MLPRERCCNVCNHRYAIYTCPRCAARTCSLPCSSTHKARTACSGQRNKAAYVPMNRYGWGTMMDDYAYLEDVGRRVGRLGGARLRGGSGGGGRTKRDVLRMQLEARDIEMNILPPGMERHKTNQSTWDAKNQTALLTVEFKIHPAPDPLALPSQPPGPPHTLLTHRNSLETPLRTLLQTHVADRKEGAVPAWVRALVCPDPSPDSDPVAWPPPHCVMSAPAAIDTAAAFSNRAQRKQKQRLYYRLDCAKSLAELLRHTQFVEFPTIEVWEEFRGTVVDAAARDGENSEGKPQPRQNGLDMLGKYEGSDDEGDGEPMQEDVLVDSDAEEQVELDAAALLELVRKARGDENWIPQPGDDDLVDWGDSDQET
ncbi:hypothetical protein B0H14DRAFT_3632132 [Mycena olivaceomarginata]|nr:hypothetical protein B0H14DRAFT_3632132 [Mycena olivaceomarginata]